MPSLLSQCTCQLRGLWMRSCKVLKPLHLVVEKHERSDKIFKALRPASLCPLPAKRFSVSYAFSFTLFHYGIGQARKWGHPYFVLTSIDSTSTFGQDCTKAKFSAPPPLFMSQKYLRPWGDPLKCVGFLAGITCYSAWVRASGFRHWRGRWKQKSSADERGRESMKVRSGYVLWGDRDVTQMGQWALEATFLTTRAESKT